MFSRRVSGSKDNSMKTEHVIHMIRTIILLVILWLIFLLITVDIIPSFYYYIHFMYF